MLYWIPGLRTTRKGKGQNSLAGVWFSHRTAEEFAELAQLELVWSYWANRKSPSRVQAESRCSAPVTWVSSGAWCLGGRGLGVRGVQQSSQKELLPVRML